MTHSTVIGPFVSAEGSRVLYVDAALTKSAVLSEPSIVDGVHWAITFDADNPGTNGYVIFDTQAAAQAVIDDWKAKK